MRSKAIFNWSGGKDSALALNYVLQNGDFEVTTLLTSVNSDTDRISMHGICTDLLQRQVEAIGIPLSLLKLPGEISMEDYDRLMSEKMKELMRSGVTHSIFGDIFLEDLKNYREQKLQEVGLSGHFPLWKRKTRALVEEFLALGFKTMVVAIDGSKLDKQFVGRVIDKDFLDDLPPDVDPCGENGEFHTFVFDGPIFNSPVDFQVGEVVAKEYKLSKAGSDKVTYWFQDLIP